MPHVPGAEVAVFERGDLRHHEYEGPHQDRLDAAYRLVELAAEHGSMTRLPRRVPDIRPERQRPRYLGALHPAAAPPERRRAPSSRRATTRSTMLPTVTHDIPSRRLTAVRSVTCARYAANSSNPDVNTLLPLAHGTCSTFTPAATPARHPPRRIPRMVMEPMSTARIRSGFLGFSRMRSEFPCHHGCSDPLFGSVRGQDSCVLGAEFVWKHSCFGVGGSVFGVSILCGCWASGPGSALDGRGADRWFSSLPWGGPWGGLPPGSVPGRWAPLIRLWAPLQAGCPGFRGCRRVLSPNRRSTLAMRLAFNTAVAT